MSMKIIISSAAAAAMKIRVVQPSKLRLTTFIPTRLFSAGGGDDKTTGGGGGDQPPHKHTLEIPGTKAESVGDSTGAKHAKARKEGKTVETDVQAEPQLGSIFAGTKLRTSFFEAEASLNFADHPRNLASHLERTSAYLKVTLVKVSETEKGMRYFIPLGGVEPMNVEFQRRGILMDVTIDGSPQRIADLLLPEHEGEKYSPHEDYETTFKNGEAELVILRYLKGSPNENVEH